MIVLLCWTLLLQHLTSHACRGETQQPLSTQSQVPQFLLSQYSVSQSPAIQSTNLHSQLSMKPPVTQFLTTQYPDVQSPLSQLPISQSSVSQPFSSLSPESQPSVSQSPESQPQESHSSVSETPVSQSPVSQLPVLQFLESQPPVSQSSVSQPPVSQSSVSQPPVSQSSVSQPPVSQSSVTSSAAAAMTTPCVVCGSETADNSSARPALPSTIPLVPPATSSIAQVSNSVQAWTELEIFLSTSAPLFLTPPDALDNPFAKVPYVWRRRITSAERFLVAYGLRVCDPRASVSVLGPYRSPSLKSFPCLCDTQCHLYNACCYDEARDLTAPSSAVGCLQAGYLGLVDCPADWPPHRQDSWRACREGRGLYTRDEPVTDPDTGLVYRNSDCAACHGAGQNASAAPDGGRLVPWAINVSCAHFQYVYMADSYHAFMLLVLQHPTVCEVKNEPPVGLSPLKCPSHSSEWLDRPVFNACNGTGQGALQDVDDEVASNCVRFRALALRTHSGSRLYQNLFCAMCDGVTPLMGMFDLGVDFSAPPKERLPPLSLLLGLHSYSEGTDSEAANQCLATQWLNLFTNQCRNLTCTAGKTLVNGTCSTAVSMIAGLAYTVDATFVLTPPVRGNSSLYLYMLQEEIVESLENSTLKIDLKIYLEKRLVMFSPNLTSNNTILTIVETGKLRITGQITASRSLGRDSAEQRLVNVFFKLGWNITVDNTEVLVQPISVYNITKKIPAVNMNLGQRLIYSSSTSWDAIYFNTDLTVFLSPMLVCPYLIFNKSEFVLQTAETNGLPDQVILIYGEENMTLPTDDETLMTWMNKDELYVCQEALNKLARAVPGEVWPWQTVLSLIVLPTSLLCLLLTLVVYSLLPALRTLPGLNVMGTCLALFLAQLSLLLASQRALSGLGPWCRALGMLVHGAWLSFFSWTWLCSLHMYRAFSATTFRPSAPGLSLRLARNLAFTLLLPALVVALVVTVSYVTSEGRTMGYSEKICYLDSTLLVGLSVILPVAVLVTVNIVLFLLTARRIHLVSKLSPHSDKDHESQHHVHVCLRLSVLTGATWVLSLIAETLDLDWLQSLSIVANGGQGVLLFLSYVVSRRMAAMLAVRLGLREETSIYTTSSAAHSKPSAGHATSHVGQKKSH